MQCCLRRIDCRASGSQSVFVDVRVRWRVCIEIVSGCSYPREMIARVRPKQRRFTRGDRLAPFPIRVPIFQ
jgi:hypothetical protein